MPQKAKIRLEFSYNTHVFVACETTWYEDKARKSGK